MVFQLLCEFSGVAVCPELRPRVDAEVSSISATIAAARPKPLSKPPMSEDLGKSSFPPKIQPKSRKSRRLAWFLDDFSL